MARAQLGKSAGGSLVAWSGMLLRIALNVVNDKSRPGPAIKRRVVKSWREHFAGGDNEAKRARSKWASASRRKSRSASKRMEIIIRCARR